MQVTNIILMIRPTNFRMNEQTAVNNYFQETLQLKNQEVNQKAQQEFDAFVAVLQSCGIRVIVEEDSPEHDTPDAVFPNNWVSFHSDGTVCLYPMFAENRRRERRTAILDSLKQQGFRIRNRIDYTAAEKEGAFLEGTGSMVIDRVHRKVYCALSQRADEQLLLKFCKDFNYSPITFHANQTVAEKRLPIYHTNVMMAIAETFVVICLDSIDDADERENVVQHITESARTLIPITETQMHRFAGNMLQVMGTNAQRFMVMSTAAYHSLRYDQIRAIEKHCAIIHSPLTTIETCGGGSARCMMAEVFLP